MYRFENKEKKIKPNYPLASCGTLARSRGFKLTPQQPSFNQKLLIIKRISNCIIMDVKLCVLAKVIMEITAILPRDI